MGEERIEIVEIKKDSKGKIKKIIIFFGPHHFINIESKKGKTKFRIGTTHHGIEADASDVPSELESFIDEIRRNHPKNGIDEI